MLLVLLNPDYILLSWLCQSILLEMYRAMLPADSMSKSTRKGIITLISKCKGRPILLLNVDYKILSRVIGNWIKSGLRQVIHPDQTCAIFVLLSRTIACTQDGSGVTCLISLDEERTFDRMFCSFIIDMLPQMGFVKWIQLFLHGHQSYRANESVQIDSFPIKSGVRQCCPLSR